MISSTNHQTESLNASYHTCNLYIYRESTVNLITSIARDNYIVQAKNQVEISGIFAVFKQEFPMLLCLLMKVSTKYMDRMLE